MSEFYLDQVEVIAPRFLCAVCLELFVELSPPLSSPSIDRFLFDRSLLSIMIKNLAHFTYFVSLFILVLFLIYIFTFSRIGKMLIIVIILFLEIKLKIKPHFSCCNNFFVMFK